MRVRNVRSSVIFSLLAAFALSLFVVSATAQSGTTGISGTVTDQNGAAVPGATVTLVNPDTNQSRTITTDSDGKYSFPGIQPATYRLEVTAANFKKLINNNVKALVDSPIVVNLALQPGEVSAIVDVTADNIESIVNTQDASLGNNFESRQISELPADLRRVADLLNLQPGVTREGYVAGGRSDQANVLLDGVDINDQQNGGRTEQFQTSQDTVLRATAESVEEFRITTTNANANQGRSSGAQISLITKSGTNNFRGSLFYFYRPTAFSANTFFNNAAGRYAADDFTVLNGTNKAGDEIAPRPSLARKIFGGSLAGPIVKDKLFFFYTYEGQRQKQEISVVRTVPLAHVGQGQLKFFGTVPGETLCDPDDPEPGCVNAHPITLTLADLNSVYSVAGINPLAVAALREATLKYPSNDRSVGDGINTGGFRFNAPTTTSENTHITRFDYKLNKSHSMYFRGNIQYDFLTGASQFPDTLAGTRWDHPWGFVAGHDWAINSNMINNFRYGLTRQAFSTTGDSNGPAISFRFVFSPLAYSRSLDRVTPTQNITDDLTWIKGNHTFQFGGNIRIIRNKRRDFGSAYDSAVTNPSFYDFSGEVVEDELLNAGYDFPGDQVTIIENTATALIGRFSQYAGNFTYDINGEPLPQGTPTLRNFATEEYDLYAQDAWKIRPNLTVTLGLRYGLSRPVYEKNGFQVVPSERLGDFFDRRVASAAQGIPLNDLIQFELAGPANNGPGFYSMDWNNWQPRVAVAWSPNFKSGFLGKFFGKNGESVFRGGWGMVSDHFGEQLAVSFSGLSTIGFTEQIEIAANTYDVTGNLAPRFTGFNQVIRGLDGVPTNPPQRFDTPADEAQRIESSLDATIKTPKHYVWNVSYGRRLPGGLYVEASYIGRKARNLLAARDVMALNNLVDPQSGMDWYTAAGILNNFRSNNTPIDQVPVIPYFQHLFPNYTRTVNGVFLNSTQRIYRLVARGDISGPAGGGLDILDWTFVQSLIDDAGIYPNMFFHPQYAAFSSFSSVARSDYNGATLSVRQRLGETLTWDFNYTWSKSFDDASGLQTGDSYGSQFILNPLRQEDNYSVSDFDITHSINANFIFQIPYGRGRKWFNGSNSYVDQAIGGWQLSGIFRWNTGLPIFSPFDAAQWATNWNAQSSGVRIRDVRIQVDRNTQNAFADPEEAYSSWRNARAGETGDRNVLRLPGFSTLDLGLSKSFRMPWEDHSLQIRWEVINVTNAQYFNADEFTRSSWGLQQDPDLGGASADFGKIFTSIQGVPRRMQFGVRYSF